MRAALLFDGKELSWPFSAQKRGIGIIYQKPILNEQYDVVSNIFLGNEMGWPENWGWFKIINDSNMDREARRILAQLGVKLKSTHEKVSNLSGCSAS